MNSVPRLWQLSLLALLLGGTACRDPADATPVAPPEPEEAATTPDRLPPGELLPGAESVFGFAVPRAMAIDAQFPGRVYIKGTVPQALVSDYVRSRVVVQHVQVEGRRYIFPKARIRGGGSALYRFEVSRDGTQTSIFIKELKAPPAIEGLSDEERWKQAGMRPDGSLIDPQNLE